MLKIMSAMSVNVNDENDYVIDGAYVNAEDYVSDDVYVNDDDPGAPNAHPSITIS